MNNVSEQTSFITEATTAKAGGAGPEATPKNSHMAKKLPSLRVLIVDDEPLIRWSLSETLLASGHSVIEACDGETALRTLSEGKEPVDVIVLDYRLPDSNDLSLLSTLRRLAPFSQIIMMTAFGTPDMTNGALNLGAYRVVAKPFEMHDMAALVLQAYDARPH
jgi:two-component system response regulator AtoC